MLKKQETLVVASRVLLVLVFSAHQLITCIELAALDSSSGDNNNNNEQQMETINLNELDYGNNNNYNFDDNQLTPDAEAALDAAWMTSQRLRRASKLILPSDSNQLIYNKPMLQLSLAAAQRREQQQQLARELIRKWLMSNGQQKSLSLRPNSSEQQVLALDGDTTKSGQHKKTSNLSGQNEQQNAASTVKVQYLHQKLARDGGPAVYMRLPPRFGRWVGFGARGGKQH